MTNTVLIKDSLFETNAGVPLVSHIPSGSGATPSTGNPWSNCSGSSGMTSVTGGGFTGNGASSNVYLPSSSLANNNSVSCTLSFAQLANNAASVALWADGSGNDGYLFMWNGFTNTFGLYYYATGNGGPAIGTFSYSLTVNTPVVMTLTRTVANNTATLTCYINGSQVAQYTHTAYLGNMYAGLQGYSAYETNFSCFEADNTGGNPPPPPTYTANVFCHGDSITYGFDQDATGGRVAVPYPVTLANALPGYQVNGYGTPGYTLSQLNAQFSSVVQPKYVSGIQNIVVLQGFWNDCLSGLPAAQILININTYASTAISNGWKVIFMSPTTGYYLSLPGNQPALNEQVRQTVLAGLLTTQYNPGNILNPAYPGFDAKYGNYTFCQTDTTIWSSDHLHFNQNGYNGLAPFVQVGVLQCLNP